MDDSRMLQTILHKLEKLDNIEKDISDLKSDVSAIKEDISAIKEDSEITRNGVNMLLDWAEKAELQINIPLYKKED